MLGDYKVHVRLTVDLIPAIDVTVYREGETINAPVSPKAVETKQETPVEEAEPAEETKSE
jgi:hypothetical protein